jgi:hypothetical protein
MELELEDYWRVVRPRRAKPVDAPTTSYLVLEPLVEWVGGMSPESKSYQVIIGDYRESYIQHLLSVYPFRSIVRAAVGYNTDLVSPLAQVLRDRKISSALRGLLDFEPPEPLEWDLIWCLVASPDFSVSSSILDIAATNPKLVSLYRSVEELRFEYFHRRVLISIEEGISRLIGSLSHKKKDHLDSLLFLCTLAYDNGLLEPFIVYLDTKYTINGLVETLQAFKTWGVYGNPIKLLVGCEEHTKFTPMLHKYLSEGLEWTSSK